MSPELQQHTESVQQFVFRCGDAWFAVPAITVRELTMAPEVAVVPGCDPSLEGICRQQSEFIPVIAIDNLLQFDATNESEVGNQLLTLAGSHVWSIRIAEAIGLKSLDTIGASELSGDANHHGVVGTATCGDNFVRVLNPDQLYQRVAQQLESSWGPANIAVGQ